MKKYICFLLFFALFLAIGNNAVAQDKAVKGRILVSLDFTQALAEVLTKGTGIEVTLAIARDYSPESHVQYLKKHFNDFAKKAERADCVITLKSVWPADPLYPWARRANIRIVDVDAAQPLNGLRAGVALLNFSDGRLAGNAWYSPGNAARMTDIVAADLIQIFPDFKNKIQNNLDKFKRTVFQLRSRYETAFAELDSFEVLALTDKYYYLTDELGIMVDGFMLKPEIDWQQEDLDKLKDALVSGNIKGVLCAWQPNEAIAEIIKQCGAQVIVAKPFKLTEANNYDAQLVAFYEHNLKALLTGLQEQQ